MQAELRLRVSKVHYVLTVFIHHEAICWRKDTQNFGNTQIYCRNFANRAAGVDGRCGKGRRERGYGGRSTGNWNIFAFFGYKIWFYFDNVLILWLKGMRNGGIELQPCLSRYILWAVYCFFFNTAPPGSCKKAIAQKVLFLDTLVVKLGGLHKA